MEGPTRPVHGFVGPCRAGSHVGSVAHVAAVSSEWHSWDFPGSLQYGKTSSEGTNIL